MVVIEKTQLSASHWRKPRAWNHGNSERCRRRPAPCSLLHPVYWLEHPPDLVVAIISKRLIAGWWATCDLLSRLEVALKEGRDEVEAEDVETLNRCSGR